MGYQVFLRIIRCIKLNAEICRITASRPLRFNFIENQIFVTLKQQPVLSLLTPAGRSPKNWGIVRLWHHVTSSIAIMLPSI